MPLRTLWKLRATLIVVICLLRLHPALVPLSVSSNFIKLSILPSYISSCACFCTVPHRFQLSAPESRRVNLIESRLAHHHFIAKNADKRAPAGCCRKPSENLR